ncbi:hypothetical protein A6M14_09715 [Acinetobacter sp. Ac_877]|uniref:hypothetical protein n=1 Tax=Acinetobacter portensis TaxID=1839785 RepID=UPI00128BB1FD|nr:hypothetical protein [Acinetobacter portensis]MPW41745.1 hypothetical protein [Acinetobacter portensis]
MNIQKKIKCIIACTIALIIVLIISSIIYLGCSKDSSPVINSLTLIGGYVGAITTLAAAYIASLLYVDWRSQIKYSVQLQNLNNAALIISELMPYFKKIRGNYDNYLFLNDRFQYITNKKTTINTNLKLTTPDLSMLNNIISNLEQTLTSMSIYSIQGENGMLHDEISRFGISLQAWLDGFKFINDNFNNLESIKKIPLTHNNIKDYADNFCDCNSVFYYENIDELGNAYNIYSHNEINIYYDLMGIGAAIESFINSIEK